MLATLLPLTAAGAQDGAERIGRADDPISAAIDISQATFADGSAAFVILGRDDVFADNLGGAALAGLPGDQVGGPLLFTEGGPDGRPTAAIVDEINRVLGPRECQAGDPPDVYVLGGTDAVSNITEEGLAEGSGLCTWRLSGPTRVETAVAVAEELGGPIPDQVLLARSDDWADSATGGAYAAATGSPILVTPSGSLAQPVRDYLADHTPGEIVLLGGTSALSATVADQAATYAPVRRVAGDARDLTAIAIAQQLWGSAIQGATLVPGYAPDGWAYALSGAVPAAQSGWPELYTQPDVLTGSTRDFLAASGATGVLAVGSADRISDGVLAEAAQAVGATPPPPPGDPTEPTAFAYALYDTGVHLVDEHRVDTELQPGPARGDLSWAPDGTALAITFADGSPEGTEGFDEAGDIAIIAPEGDPFFDLRSTPGSQEFTQPVWSPDGDRLAVVGVDPGASRILYDRAIGGQTVGSLFPLTTPEDGFVSLASPQAWGPDGDRIAVTLSGEVAIVDRTTQTITRLGVQGAAPAFSPSGDALAYTTASRSYVIELGADPAAATPTDVGPIAGTQPVWLDDDRILLAGENTSDQTNAVWILHRDGSPPTFEASVADPAITADLAANGGDLGIVSHELGAVVIDAFGEFGFGTDDHVTDLRFQP